MHYGLTILLSIVAPFLPHDYVRVHTGEPCLGTWRVCSQGLTYQCQDAQWTRYGSRYGDSSGYTGDSCTRGN